MHRSVALLAAAACAATLAGPAFAGSARDRVHADSFGNLVINSAAGYKRIIVGAGEAAEGYNATGSYYEPAGDVRAASRAAPRIVYGDARAPSSVRCWRPPHVWHGRGYMTGLAEGVVPQAPLVCE